MIEATKDFLKQNDAMFEKQKNKILKTKDELKIYGDIYYVSNSGDDANDGKTPETAWKTLEKVSSAHLAESDGVLFNRGDLFRGSVKTQPGVTYAAYGSGDKPKFYGGDKDYADPSLWEEYDRENYIWKCKGKMLDTGTLVFNCDKLCSRKLIPTYRNLQFVCRDDENRVFDVRNEMTEDLDIYWDYDRILTSQRSKGEDFPIPLLMDECYGELYLRCDKGNPGNVFDTIESVPRRSMFAVGSNKNVTIDNICIKYVGMHGVAAGGYVVGLCVKNCEIGWIGGSIQSYYGTDPNYPEGRRGSVTRFGNAIEIYGGCENFTVENNYIYEVYDAAITHQVTTDRKLNMSGIRYTDNVIEKCVYGIEYFLDQIDGERESCMNDVVINGNFIRLGGYGWGQQRHNKHTPALIKGWSYVNTARNFKIYDNIFDRCAYQMLHLVALKDEFCPEMHDNIYIQYDGGVIGQYGGNEVKEPDILIFDDKAEEKLTNVFGEKNLKVYIIK